MIRRATHADIDFMLNIARERYPVFNEREAEAWLMHTIGKSDMIVLRSDHAALIATLARPFWSGQLRCHLLFLACRRFPGLSRKGLAEGLALMRAADHERQIRGAQSFHFSEDTGANYAVLAKYLGAKHDRPSYTLGGSPLSLAAELFGQNEASPPRRNVSALEQILGVM